MVDVGGLDDAGRSTLNALGLERGRDGGVQVKEPRAPGTRVCRCFRVRVCWAFVLLLVALACAGVGALPLLLPLYEDRTCLEAATLQAGEQVACATTRLDARAVVTVDRRDGMGAWRFAADRVPYAAAPRTATHTGAGVVHGAAVRAELVLFLLRGSTLAADVAANETVRVLVMTDAQHDAFVRAPAQPHPRAEAVFVGTAVTNFTHRVAGPGPGAQLHFVVTGASSAGAARPAAAARPQSPAPAPAFVQWTVRAAHRVVDVAQAQAGTDAACAFARDRATCAFDLGAAGALLAPRALLVAGAAQPAGAGGVHVVQITLAYSRAVAVGATLAAYVALLLAAAGVCLACCMWDAERVQRHRDRALHARLFARRVRFGRNSLRRIEPYDAYLPPRLAHADTDRGSLVLDDDYDGSSADASAHAPLLGASGVGSSGTYDATESATASATIN